MTDTVIREMKLIFGDDRKRINHALEVLKYASAICDSEFPGNSRLRETVVLAAILHDIGIKQGEAKFNSAAPIYQHSEGPPLAQKILTKAGIAENMSLRVLSSKLSEVRRKKNSNQI